MIRVSTFLAVLITLGLFSTGSSAHHAFSAEFDVNKPVELRGKVTRVEWINPHAWVHLLAELEDGTTQAWMVEGGTPNALFRRGFNRDSIAVGTEIVVHGFQSRDGVCDPRCKANGRDITLPNGQTLFMGATGIGAPPANSGSNEQ